MKPAVKKTVKKIGLLGIVVSSLALTACSPDAGYYMEGDTEGFTREVITVGGEKFDCVFENRHWNSGTMSCTDLNVKAIPGEQDSEDFSRETVTSGEEKFDCIFANRDWESATMDCFPVASK